jgi:monomeric isocitrate dehydrogenase
MTDKQLKSSIIELIEKGYNNQEIVAAVNTADEYVVSVRCRYNKVEGIERKRSLHKAPKVGTQCRTVYDYIVEHPGCSFGELLNNTGIDSSLCGYVRRRYFGLHGTRGRNAGTLLEQQA